MRFGSLFTGVGGMDLGLEWAGMECAWQVEINDYCNKVLEKHWPNVERFRDVKEVGKHNLKPVDLIAGGFPCQPHSVAGKQKGAADDRNLWPEFIRIIRETRPRYVLAENVPGIITTYLDTVLSDLEGEAYSCWTFNIPACAFDAPHRRERIFIVAYAQSEQGRNKSKDARYGKKGRGRGEFRPRCLDVADTKGTGKHNSVLRKSDASCLGNGGGWFSTEPDVGRVAHGIPSRVDRLRGLGNAVVPQVAEWIGKRIMEFDAT